MDAHVFIDDSQLDRMARLCQDSPQIFQQALKATLRRVGGNMRKNIRKGIKGESYLKSGVIGAAIGRLQIRGAEAKLTVAGSRLAGHKFRMIPDRVTARKGTRSVNWPSPGVKIGPQEPVRHASDPDYSKPFIIKTKSGLKAMFWRKKADNSLEMPGFAPPQYFAAFDRVQTPVMSEAERTFLQRLEHEIDYRLGLGR